MSLFLLAFNDQVLPRANFQLKTLQDAIAQTKPTFLHKDQVNNAIQEERLYLKAGRIDRSNGHMKEVVIYDLTSPERRRTIYADSGAIGFAPNQKDLALDLYSGQMQTVSTEKPGQLDRLFYDSDRIIVRNVGSQFEKAKGDTLSRGDRELSVCAMQKRLTKVKAVYDDNRAEYLEALRVVKLSQEKGQGVPIPTHRPSKMREVEPKNLAWGYCRLLARLVGVKAAEAAEPNAKLLHAVQDTVPKRAAQDTAPKRPASDSASTVILGTSRPPAPGSKGATPVPPPAALPPELRVLPPAGASKGQAPPPAPATTFKDPFLARTKADSDKAYAAKRNMTESEIAERVSHAADVKLRYEISQRTKNRFEIEINKKFALAAACLIFVMLGAPLALRFPRGGVGLVLLVSLVVFALYYVGLIGGESLANKGIIPPFWAMWWTNAILTVIGVILLLRMGHEENSGRGGNWTDRWDRVRDFFARRRQPVLVKEAA
jgi:lipopolysaccharide export system permease protein